MNPRISEVLTFSGWLVFCTSACLPGVFITRALARQPEGAWLYYMSRFLSPLQAGSSRSAVAAGLPLLRCLMSFPIIHPAPSLQRERERFFILLCNVCVGEVPRPKNFHRPFIPLVKALNGSGVLIKFGGGVPFFACRVAWPKIKIYTPKHAIVLREQAQFEREVICFQ